MKRTLALLALLGLVGSTHAATTAHWRFEEGANGVAHAGFQDDFYQDASGNGNHLSTRSAAANPTATDQVPFRTIVGGATNTLALVIVNTNNIQAVETYNANVAAKAIDSYSFSSGWTIEASFSPDRLDLWQGIVVKDGRPDSGGPFTPFQMKIQAGSGGMEVGFLDNAKGYHSLFVPAGTLEAGKRYSIAATYDGTDYKLYLRGEMDAGYLLMGSATLGVAANLEFGETAANWAVGRAMWDGNPGDWFHGTVDEVRISDTALATPEFINQGGFYFLFTVEAPKELVADGFAGIQNSFNLVAGSFWSPNGLSHTASEWQISTTNDFSSLSWSNTTGATTTAVVPGNTLPEGIFYARVRYQGDGTDWSNWSDSTMLFLAQVGIPVNVGVTKFTDWSTWFRLNASAFSSPAGLSHTASEWQVSSIESFASTNWTSGVQEAELESVVVPDGALAAGSYYGRVRYQGTGGLWSVWSASYPLDMAPTATLAYWRFEDGTSGLGQDESYIDVSENGNHMSAFDELGNPLASSTVPFNPVPQTGAANVGGIQWPGLGNFLANISTYDALTGPKMINSFALTNGWTIEISFNTRYLNWRTILSKDGAIAGNANTAFVMKIRDDSKSVEVGFFDDTDTYYSLQTTPLSTNAWYSLVATYNNVDFKLYLKSQSDSNYVLINNLTIGGTASLGTIPADPNFGNAWNIGRGLWAGNLDAWYDGEVDEVRITHGALNPAEFLETQLPPPPGIGAIQIESLGAAGMALTWTSAPEYSYAILGRDDLIYSDWTIVQSGIQGEPTSITATTSVSQAQFFYKVVSEQ